MTSVRFETEEDTINDCLTITDSRDQLKTSFGSDIVLYPAEDASAVVDELNVQCAVNEMLIEHLERYEDPDDIMYWINEIMEDM